MTDGLKRIWEKVNKELSQHKIILRIIGIFLCIELVLLDVLELFELEKFEELSFNILLEAIFVLAVIILVDKSLRKREEEKQEKERRPVSGAVFMDAYSIYRNVCSLISRIMTHEIKNTSPGVDLRYSDASYDFTNFIDQKISLSGKWEQDSTWKSFLIREIRDIYWEVENYMQRHNAFLMSPETGKHASDLLNLFTSFRAVLKSVLKRMENFHHTDDKDEISLKFAKENGNFYLYVNGNSEPISKLDFVNRMPVEKLRQFYDVEISKRYEEELFGGGDELRDAWFNLGLMYERGWGISRDDEKAAEWYRKAAGQGHAVAQNNLGLILLHRSNSSSETKQIPDAELWLRRAAEQNNDAVAQNNLGDMYRHEEDYVEATKWYSKAARRGYATAQNNLGDMYKNGLVADLENSRQMMKFASKHDFLKMVRGYAAEKEYKEAADKGLVDAQFNLGEMYYESAQDISFQYEIGGNLGLSPGMSDIYEGLDITMPSDDIYENRYNEAKYQFIKAVVPRPYSKNFKRGYDKAQYRLGDIYRLRGDDLKWRNPNKAKEQYREAEKWYRKAVEQGHIEAQHQLAIMFGKTQLSEQNDIDVLKWLHMAAGIQDGVELSCCRSDEQENADTEQAEANGQTDAQNYLGIMYREGRNVEQNDSMAMCLFCKAAARGHRDARNHLGVMYRDGRGCVGQNDLIEKARKEFKEATAPIICYDEFGDIEKEEPGHPGAIYNLKDMSSKKPGNNQDLKKELISCFEDAFPRNAAGSASCLLEIKRTTGSHIPLLNAGYLETGQDADIDKDIKQWVIWCARLAKEISKNDTALSGYRWAHAEYRLGVIYEQFLDEEHIQRDSDIYDRNLEVAIAWYKLAARPRPDGGPGHSEAQYKLGLMYEKKWDNHDQPKELDLPLPNFDEAMRWYSEAAKPRWNDKQGHADSQYRLGIICESKSWYSDETETWHRTKPDQAERWYRKAAEQRQRPDNKQYKHGHADAQYRLGDICKQRGDDLHQSDPEKAKKEYREAEEWYSKAAEPCGDGESYERGHAGAQYRLGDICKQRGDDLHQSDPDKAKEQYRKAEEWYEKAAEPRGDGESYERGHAGAQYRLGDICKQRGDDLHQSDPDKAKEQYRKAEEWYEKAAEPRGDGEPYERGHAGAQYRLGDICKQRGDDLHQSDPDKAKEQYRKAEEWCFMAATQGFVMAVNSLARRGHAGAQYRLGDIYRQRGDDLRQSDSEKAKEQYRGAKHWYSKAAEPRGDGEPYERGHAGAQYRLGDICKQRGDDLHQSDPEKAKEQYRRAKHWYSKAAEPRGDGRPHERGHTGAQYRLGRMYEKGQGVPRCCHKAIVWYEKAAEQKHSCAQLRLGNIYEWGREWETENFVESEDESGFPHRMYIWAEIECNKKMAECWYEKAASLGHAHAQYKLGDICKQRGDDLSRRQPDPEKAKEQYREAEDWYSKAKDWYSEAAKPRVDSKLHEQGHAGAQYRLGVIYQEGFELGFPKEFGKAENMYRMAAAPRSDGEHRPEQDDAQRRLGYICKQRGDDLRQSDPEKANEQYLEAENWYSKAAVEQQGEGNVHYKQDRADAQYRLGVIYQEGLEPGFPKELGKAKDMYRNAADQGHADAQYRLGLMYEDGQGVPICRDTAVEFYKKAADSKKPDENGHADAQYRLGLYEEKKQYREAEKWYSKAAAPRPDGEHYKQGHPDAQYRLGVIYYEKAKEAASKPDMKKDEWYRKAVKWFRRAAENRDDGHCMCGHPAAQYELGMMYEQGLGVARAESEAKMWMYKAATQKYCRAVKWVEEKKIDCQTKDGFNGQG